MRIELELVEPLIQFRTNCKLVEVKQEMELLLIDQSAILHQFAISSILDLHFERNIEKRKEIVIPLAVFDTFASDQGEA
jgi:hypothetical protein